MALRTSNYAVTQLSKRVKKGEVAVVNIIRKNGTTYYTLDDTVYNETIHVPTQLAPEYWEGLVIR